PVPHSLARTPLYTPPLHDPLPISAARELPPRRRAAGRGPAGTAGRAQLLRVSPPIVVLPRGARDASGRGRGARRRRPSGEALPRSEEHTSELQSPYDIVCRLLLDK